MSKEIISPCSYHSLSDEAYPSTGIFDRLNPFTFFTIHLEPRRNTHPRDVVSHYPIISISHRNSSIANTTNQPPYSGGSCEVTFFRKLPNNNYHSMTTFQKFRSEIKIRIHYVCDNFMIRHGVENVKKIFHPVKISRLHCLTPCKLHNSFHVNFSTAPHGAGFLSITLNPYFCHKIPPCVWFYKYQQYYVSRLLCLSNISFTLKSSINYFPSTGYKQHLLCFTPSFYFAHNF